jgi:lactoylglutathione lyase
VWAKTFNMPASLRMELFPSSLERFIEFYTKVLRFTVIKHEGEYVYIQRDDIFLGAIEAPSSETAEEKAVYRQPRKGVEIVFEVDELEQERDYIVNRGISLETDIRLQPWGLEDFRLVDPDGYYLRITTHSPNRDGTK